MRIQSHSRSMGLLSFIYWLLTGPRSARRQTTGTVRELTHSKFSEEFFGAAWSHCEPQPVRSEISKIAGAELSRGECGPE